jgi:hypothetical protein
MAATPQTAEPVVLNGVDWRVFDAHYGFVYALAMRKLPKPNVLSSGSGFHNRR